MLTKYLPDSLDCKNWFWGTGARGDDSLQKWSFFISWTFFLKMNKTDKRHLCPHILTMRSSTEFTEKKRHHPDECGSWLWTFRCKQWFDRKWGLDYKVKCRYNEIEHTYLNRTIVLPIMMTLRVEDPQECLSMMFDNGQQGSLVVSLRCRDACRLLFINDQLLIMHNKQWLLNCCWH